MAWTCSLEMWASFRPVSQRLYAGAQGACAVDFLQRLSLVTVGLLGSDSHSLRTSSHQHVTVSVVVK